MAASVATPMGVVPLHYHNHYSIKTRFFSLLTNLPSSPSPSRSISTSISISANIISRRTSKILFTRFNRFSVKCFSTISTNTTDYEFSDNSSEVELRLRFKGEEIPSSRDIYVDADGTTLSVRIRSSTSPVTVLETTKLFDRVKASETIWYIDEDQLVINLKKNDAELKWPDIVESWESLAAGSMQLLQGTSIYIVGDSTEINQKVGRELAVGLGYTPLDTQELLESYAKQTIESWMLAEGPDSVALAESTILESLSSHVRAVVATLGGNLGTARMADKWQHLHAGFTVWLSQTEATDEESAKEEARNMKNNGLGYSNADVVVKLNGWDSDHAKTVAQASLSALKQLILTDKKLPGKKSLYIRLGCRGDWPNIRPPGWDPSAETDGSLRTL